MLPTPVQVSLSALELAEQGRFEELRERFASSLRPMVTADALQAAWSAAIARLGPVASVGTPLTESSAGIVVVKVPVHCQRGDMTLIVSMAPTGELAGIQLAPPEAMVPMAAWEAPAYVDPSRFEEQDIVLGSGPRAVPANLSLPRQPRPLPAVVLLAGSGPMDRDETIGPNKPFKDLAWGLASRGIAVLRFDKVTSVHAAEVRNDPGFTLTDEYLPEARAAIELLRSQAAVDPSRVFVAGHSLGGTAAPRVGAAVPTIAGLVILAGGAQPLHWVIVRQIQYLHSLDPASSSTSDSVVDTLIQQARLVDSPELLPSTPATELPLGTPASYWLDLRGYDPAAAAAELGKPTFVLQGGRDYQATVTEDLARWQAALAGRPDVTFRVYPADDHFFFAGTGPSTPQESLSPHHVDQTVIDDLATWLQSTRTRS